MARNRKKYNAYRRKNKAKRFNQTVPKLSTQARRGLWGTKAFSHSKRAAKEEDKISRANGEPATALKRGTFSIKYMNNNQYICSAFIRYVMENHPECKYLDDAKNYADEWLLKKQETISPGSEKTYRCALEKLFQCPFDDFIATSKKMERTDITRSRDPAKRDKNFNQNLHLGLVLFCICTGLRREELENLHGRCAVLHNDGNWYLHLRNYDNEEGKANTSTKNARDRQLIIAGTDEEVAFVLNKVNSVTSDQLVWGPVNTNADIQSFRGIYADRVYLMYARPFKVCIADNTFYSKEHKKFENCVYRYRKDRKGQWSDKKAMLIVAHNLGHGRISVCADHYISVVTYLPE